MMKGMGQVSSRITVERIIPGDLNGMAFLAKIQTNNLWYFTGLIITKHFCCPPVCRRLVPDATLQSLFLCQQEEVQYWRTVCKALHDLAPACSFSLASKPSFPCTVQVIRPSRLMNLFVAVKHPPSYCADAWSAAVPAFLPP